MKEHKTSISDLMADDLFHAAFSSEAVRICIVTAVDDTAFTARALMTQEIFRFDRRSGASIPFESGDAVCTIDSIAPLPDGMRDALLGYDLRCRTSKESDAGRLTVEEREALLQAGKLYGANPLKR